MFIIIALYMRAVVGPLAVNALDHVLTPRRLFPGQNPTRRGPISSHLLGGQESRTLIIFIHQDGRERVKR